MYLKNIKNQAEKEEILSIEMAHVSLSQFGEDLVFLHWNRNKRNGKYVDVGCHLPKDHSNTYLLYHMMGWRGLNVDLNPNLIAQMKENRPEDTCVTAAISNHTAPVDATFFRNAPGVTTLNATFADRMVNVANREVEHVRSVTPITLAQLMCDYPEYQDADYLNVDVEWHDLEVLQSNDWSIFSPEWISVETGGWEKDGKSVRGQPIFDLLLSKGYEAVSHMVITTLFRKGA